MDFKKQIELLKSCGGWDYHSECVRDEDARFGCLFGNQGRQPKDWRPYLPEFENQRSSAYCLTFSILNCFETLIKYKNEGREINFSDRWTGVKAKTTMTGNTFNNVADAIRKYGLTLERYCPWKPEWLENPPRYWNQINTLPTDVKIVSGKTFNHSWVRTDLASLRDALADTPLWIGVGIGYNWENSVVSKPSSYAAYHGVELVYIDDKYKYIFDSLGNSIKRLSLNYPILYAKSGIRLPSGWQELNTMNKNRILYKGDQFSEKNKKIRFIPDEATLMDLIFEGNVSSEEPKEVSSLDGYERLNDYPSAVVYEEMKALFPKLKDAFEKMDKSVGGYRKEPTFWTKLKNIIRK